MIVINVKGVEDVFSELHRISRGEKPPAEAPEFLLADMAFWKVSHEFLVPVCVRALPIGHTERRMSMKDAIGLRRDACQELSSSWLTG